MELSNMDLCDDWENALSSEEYSDDDLIDATIKAKNQFEASKKPSKSLNSPFKRHAVKSMKKFASIAKKRSIIWLNTKKKRDKYKILILKTAKENLTEKSSSIDTYNKTNCCDKKTSIPKDIPSINSNTYDLTSELINLPKEKMEETNAAVRSDQFEKDLNSCQGRQIKRSVSVPPTLVNPKCTSMDDATCMSKNSLLFNEVNKLFPKYNKVLKDFVSSSTNSVESIEMKISEILTEIQELSDIIQTKEFEWNKLLHLRKVKEEIIMQLARKKNIMELNINEISKKNSKMSKQWKQNSFSSGYSINPLEDSNCHQSTAQALVEHRANMNKEDLEKEKVNIKKLYSFFVSKNILPTSKCTHDPKMISDASYHTTVSDSFEKVDMKSFQQKNTDIMERRNSRIQMCDTNIGNHCNIDEMGKLDQLHKQEANREKSNK